MVVLTDLLHQTLADLECPLSWHRLARGFHATCDSDLKQRLLESVSRLTVNDARSDYLRWSFLHGLTNDSVFAHQAALRLRQDLPLIPDRTAAFVAYGWGLAVLAGQSRGQFVNTLLALQLPELITMLGAAAAKSIPLSLTPRVAKKATRVALISPYLGAAGHTPSALVARLCRVLKRLDLSVQIFSCQELSIPEAGRFSGHDRTVSVTDFDKDYWSQALPEGFGLFCSDARFSLAARWADMLQRIADFDPDLIFLVGLYSPLALALHACRPVLAMNVHALPVLSSVDVTLQSGPEVEAAWGGDGLFLFQRGEPEVFPFRLLPPVNHQNTSRADLDINEEAVVWISVGGRLGQEVGGGWAAVIVDALSRHPEVVWVLVGCAIMPPCLASVPVGQLRVLPVVQDVGSLLGIADIYLNPDRMGGGFSVAEAMGASLAALSLAESDGGDKLGPFAVSSLNDYVALLDRLTVDPRARRDLGEALRERFDARLNLDNSDRSLGCAIEKTLVHAQARFNSG